MEWVLGIGISFLITTFLEVIGNLCVCAKPKLSKQRINNSTDEVKIEPGPVYGKQKQFKMQL